MYIKYIRPIEIDFLCYCQLKWWSVPYDDNSLCFSIYISHIFPKNINNKKEWINVSQQHVQYVVRRRSSRLQLNVSSLRNRRPPAWKKQLHCHNILTCLHPKGTVSQDFFAPLVRQKNFTSLLTGWNSSLNEYQIRSAQRGHHIRKKTFLQPAEA